MTRNYFKTGWRSLKRNRMYAILNICGLAVGIAVCLVIFAVIQFHLRFDNFHADKEHIYRVLTEYHHADAPDVFYGKGVAEPLPAALRNQFPELKKVTGIYASSDDQVVVLGENGQAEKKVQGSFRRFCRRAFLF